MELRTDLEIDYTEFPVDAEINFGNLPAPISSDFADFLIDSDIDLTELPVEPDFDLPELPLNPDMDFPDLPVDANLDVSNQACARVFPQTWMCGCKFITSPIAELPYPFVRQCGEHLTDEFLRRQADLPFIAASCDSLDLDYSVIPWLCPPCHCKVFGRDDGNTEIPYKPLETIWDAIAPENIFLPATLVLGDAFAVMPCGPQPFSNDRYIVQQMRDTVK
jgi:hypothetical protein